MSKLKFGSLVAGALVAGVIPLTLGAALAQDGPRAARTADQRPGMSRYFGQMDVDKDGKVSRAEVEAFHKSRAAEIDADKDGKIAPAELRAWMDKQREKRLAERLARLDKDGDGAVSVKEYEDAGIWRAARMDRNGDGAIDSGDRRRSFGRSGHDGRWQGHRGGRH